METMEVIPWVSLRSAPRLGLPAPEEPPGRDVPADEAVPWVSLRPTRAAAAAAPPRPQTLGGPTTPSAPAGRLADSDGGGIPWVSLRTERPHAGRPDDPPHRFGLLKMDPQTCRRGVGLAPHSHAELAVLDAAHQQAYKASTVKSYNSILSGFGAYLVRQGLPFTGTVADITYRNIARYGAWFVLMAPNGRLTTEVGHNPESFSTLRSALGSWVKGELGAAWPLQAYEDHRLDLLADSLAARRPAKSYARVPVRAAHLRRAFDLARAAGDPHFRTLSTMSAVAHHALLRVSEYTGGWLRACDVEFSPAGCRPNRAVLTIRRSKTGTPRIPAPAGCSTPPWVRRQKAGLTPWACCTTCSSPKTSSSPETATERSLSAPGRRGPLLGPPVR